MKKHAIIPIFIPHKGCPNACVFCNQRKITARTEAPSPKEVQEIIETWLTTLQDVETVEVAFYGGSFTGIPIEDQSRYLSIAQKFKIDKRIQKIHLSTRPDYINKKILTNLAAYDVDTIELGVQSFDDKVLQLSGRGHNSQAVYSAVKLIHEYGFELGIQLMIGLPGDSRESCLYSAYETVRLKPKLARLYPTILLDDTELLEMYHRGEYTPLSREEAILRTKDMYEILVNSGITIMRVGLKSTDIISANGAVNAGTYHPAFRQLVEGRISRERIEALLEPIQQKFYKKNKLKSCYSNSPISNSKSKYFHRIKIDILSSPSWISNAIGNKSENRHYLQKKYPEFSLRFCIDKNLSPGIFRIHIKDNL